MVELVDTPDSKSGSARSGGSIPSTGTNQLIVVVAILALVLAANLSSHLP